MDQHSSSSSSSSSTRSITPPSSSLPSSAKINSKIFKLKQILSEFDDYFYNYEKRVNRQFILFNAKIEHSLDKIKDVKKNNLGANNIQMIEKTIFEITGELIENYNILDVLSENEVKKLNKIIDTCKDDIEIDSTQFEISFNILDSIENDIEKLKIEYRNSNVKVMIEMIEKIHFKYFQIVDLYIQYKDVKKFQSTILASRLEYFFFDDYCNLNKLIKKIFNDVSSQIGLTFDFSTSCDHLDDPIENRILFKLTFRFLLELKTMRFNKYPWNGSKSLTLKADGDDMIDRVDPLVLIWGPWEEMLDENEVSTLKCLKKIPKLKF